MSRIEIDSVDFGEVLRKRLREERTAREGRTGIASGRACTQSLPSGQSVHWREVAGTVLTLAAFFGLLAGLVAIHGGKAVLRKYGRGK